MLGAPAVIASDADANIIEHRRLAVMMAAVTGEGFGSNGGQSVRQE
jgi:hypothetical protein